MRLLATLGIACLTFTHALAYPVVSSEDAEAMRLEALGDRAPEKLLGGWDNIIEEPIEALMDVTGQDNPYDDCANTPIRAKRSDGSTVINISMLATRLGSLMRQVVQLPGAPRTDV